MPHSNFSFLEKEFPVLHNIASAAEYNLHADPVTALFKLRQLGERITDFVYETHQLDRPIEDTFHNKVKILEDEAIYQSNIASLVHNIKHRGNIAVHQSKGTVEDAKTILFSAFKFAKWFYQSYSEENNNIADLKFSLPIQVDAQDTIRQLEKEFASLETKFNAALLTNMLRHILLASILATCSACTTSEQETDWTLERIENIQHAQSDGKKIQIVYSESYAGLTPFIDTSIVVEIYKDTLQLESIGYNSRNGDTIKWRHQINEFNIDGMVLREIDSVYGTLRRRVLNFYENGKLLRRENLAIIPDYNEAGRMVGGDTMRSTSFSVYNEMGKCTKLITVSKDELSSALTGTNKNDTSITHKQFNEKFWETGSFTVTDGDTTAMSQIEYDKHGRKVAIVDFSDQAGLATFKYEYDENGNQTSELATFDDMKNLTLTEYDNLNRPVSRKSFRESNR